MARRWYRSSDDGSHLTAGQNPLDDDVRDCCRFNYCTYDGRTGTRAGGPTYALDSLVDGNSLAGDHHRADNIVTFAARADCRRRRVPLQPTLTRLPTSRPPSPSRAPCDDDDDAVFLLAPIYLRFRDGPNFRLSFLYRVYTFLFSLAPFWSTTAKFIRSTSLPPPSRQHPTTASRKMYRQPPRQLNNTRVATSKPRNFFRSRQFNRFRVRRIIF